MKIITIIIIVVSTGEWDLVSYIINMPPQLIQRFHILHNVNPSLPIVFCILYFLFNPHDHVTSGYST